MMAVAVLRSLRQSIVPSTGLIKGSKPVELPEDICISINCYAYALGILYRRQMEDFFKFNPGFASNNPDSWKKDIMKSVDGDLNILEIPHRLIPLDSAPHLEPNEYLIKVFVEKYNKDFHFVRYDPVSKTWFHKEGFLRPERMRVYEKVEHSIFGCEPSSYYFGDYRPKGYFAIKEV